MRRAYAIAVGDGGEPLDVRAEQSPEHLGLGLAQLGEVGRDVSDWAVVLANLGTAAGMLRRRRVAVSREGVRQLGGAAISGDVDERGRISGFEGGQPVTSERRDSSFAAGGLQVIERGDRDVVVGVAERGVAGVGEGEDFGWAASAAELAAHLALGYLADPADGDERIEVAADGGGGQPKAGAECDGTLRPVLMQGPSDPIAGAIILMAGGRDDAGSRVVGDDS